MSVHDKPLYPGTAVVTGGGSGLGFHIAAALRAEGYPVVVTGRNPGKLSAAVDTLSAGPGPEVRGVVCDSSDADSVSALVDELAGSPVSVLVNNAGIGGPVTPLVDIDPAEWDEVIGINLRGVFLMCRAFAPAMQERGNGFILNIASVTGKRPLENRTPYAASKMAVIGLTTTLAFELGRHGVMVNSLSPGPVDSERMDRNFEREAALSGRSIEDVTDAFVSRSALNRMVTMDEVAQAAVAALSIPGLTGSDLDVSGGMIA
jgi:NAD(P)-dependent dehydrogenase (short-subunit alcohol dehydrogenase family)